MIATRTDATLTLSREPWANEPSYIFLNKIWPAAQWRTAGQHVKKIPFIHRMQIWRTTRSAPEPSQMKARLVRHWCFVLFWQCFSGKVLVRCRFGPFLSPSLRVFLFLKATQQSGIFHSRESVIFFSFLVRLWGKTKETEARSSRSPREFFKFRLESIEGNV